MEPNPIERTTSAPLPRPTSRPARTPVVGSQNEEWRERPTRYTPISRAQMSGSAVSIPPPHSSSNRTLSLGKGKASLRRALSLRNKGKGKANEEPPEMPRDILKEPEKPEDEQVSFEGNGKGIVCCPSSKRSLSRKIGSVFRRAAKRVDDEKGELHNGMTVVKRKYPPSAMPSMIDVCTGTVARSEPAGDDGVEGGVDEEGMHRTVSLSPVPNATLGVKAPLNKLC
jgi:hypothetical protein